MAGSGGARYGSHDRFRPTPLGLGRSTVVQARGEPFDYTQAPTLAIIAGRLGASWVRQPDADELWALRQYSRR